MTLKCDLAQQPVALWGSHEGFQFRCQMDVWNLNRFLSKAKYSYLVLHTNLEMCGIEIWQTVWWNSRDRFILSFGATAVDFIHDIGELDLDFIWLLQYHMKCQWLSTLVVGVNY